MGKLRDCRPYLRIYSQNHASYWKVMTDRNVGQVKEVYLRKYPEIMNFT